MNSIPVIELRIRSMEDQVIHAIALRQDEIEEQIKEGVERALAHAPDVIVNAAMEEATKSIKTQVESYFRYGEGYKAIKTAVENSLAPLVAALSKRESD